MARPKRYKDSKQISIRLDQSLLSALDRRANELGVDRSQLINRLLSRNVESNPFEESPHNQSESPSTSPAKKTPPPGRKGNGTAGK